MTRGDRAHAVTHPSRSWSSSSGSSCHTPSTSSPRPAWPPSWSTKDPCRSPSWLNAPAPTAREPLARLVRALAPVGVFSTDGETVGVTEVGTLLSSSHPHSLLGLTRLMMQTHYLPFSELDHSVRTGSPGATQFLGAPFLDWINRD
jgi:hypothetical protein